MKKRFLSLAVALVMCLSFAVPALAAEIIDSGTCGDNLTWTLDSEGALTISGTGDMWDYTGENTLDLNTPWASNMRNIKKAILEDGVTSIGDFAFSHCSQIDSVDLPGIPHHEVEALARILLPEIQRFYESEEGQREFSAWKKQQDNNDDSNVAIPA